MTVTLIIVREKLSDDQFGQMFRKTMSNTLTDLWSIMYLSNRKGLRNDTTKQ